VKIITFPEYQKSRELSILDGARWLLIHHSELNDAATIIFLSEMTDILVAVDNRGNKITDGLWQRAVHLIIADSKFETESEKEISRRTGINKVILDADDDLENYCW
tara:strand:- start:183 stop:500 length:318 start_codon:yes stop_codon:yes gene_type:complete